MSIKTFLENLYHSLSTFFKGLKPVAKKAVQIGDEVADVIKKYEGSKPLVDMVIDKIPGHWAEDVRDQLLKWLPKMLTAIGLVDKVVNPEDSTDEPAVDPETALQQAATKLQTLEGDFRKNALHSISTLTQRKVSQLKDAEIPWSDAIHLSEAYHKDEIDTPMPETDSDDQPESDPV